MSPAPLGSGPVAAAPRAVTSGTRIFPIARVPWPPARNSTTRSSRQAWGEDIKVARLINEQVDALNWLHHPVRPLNPEVIVPNARTVEVIALLRARAIALRAVEKEDDAPSPAEALRGLLRGRRPYDAAAPGGGTLATFNDGTVSLPDDVSTSPLAADLVLDEARNYLEVPERMMREKGELDVLFEHGPPLAPYTDRVLERSRRKYRALMKQLHAAGLLQFTLQPRSTVGVFFVKKKAPRSLRLILDARLTNMMMKPPPGVCLAGPECFARIEAQLPVGISASSERGQALLDGMRFTFGTADIADAFHRLRIGPALGEFFAYPIQPSGAGVRTGRGHCLGRASLR